MNLLIRVPAQHETLTAFLECLHRQTAADGLELPGTVLENESGWEDLLEAYDLRCLALADLLPDSVARYLPEAEEGARAKVLTHLRQLVTRAAALDIRYIGLGVGIERVSLGALEPALERRTQVLRSLMPLAEAQEIITCIPVRMPAPGMSNVGLQHSVRLVHEVMHPNCRLALDVFVDEFEPDFKPNTVIKDYCFSLALIRFHYEPALGITFPLEQQREWAKALRWLGYRGGVVFCPQVSGPEMLRGEVERLAPVVAAHWRATAADE